MTRQRILTTGHGNASTAELITRLTDAGVSLVVDVRSRPFSRWYPHHSRPELEKAVTLEGLSYLWKGANLGGLGVNQDFAGTVREVSELARTRTTALLCSETDWHRCHRRTMLEPAFLAEGLDVVHLNRDGTAT